MIDETQKRVHKFSEAAALVAAPFMIYLAMRKTKLTPVEHGGLGLIALVTVVVDGWLLIKWSKE